MKFPSPPCPLRRGGAEGRQVRIVAKGRRNQREVAEEGAIETLQEVYRRYARRFNGMFERSAYGDRATSRYRYRVRVQLRPSSGPGTPRAPHRCPLACL